MPDVKKVLPSVPSLVVGVGGTGVWATTYVKKDLLEIAQTGHLPPGVQVLAFDTEGNVEVCVGGYGRPREAGKHHTGPVRLEAGEYVHIGGNVYEDGVRIARGEDSHVGIWWNAKDYLADGLPAPVWNLNKGAGLYRQFGRMALFKNIQVVKEMLGSAIRNVREGASGTTSLYIHVVGSLVGGTGAGLFADIAHLARTIAQKEGISQPVVFGYFALLEAFHGTPELGQSEAEVKAGYEAKCFAALRECSRLLAAMDWASGYPMYYAPQGTDPVMRGRLSRPLYDAVYLFDGHRQYNTLRNWRIESGVAPTIADAIVAHVDSKSGNRFTSHTANLANIKQLKGIPSSVATYGTLGTFTIVLPMFHIVEDWTHRLALEVMDELLVPKERNELRVPNSLASNKRGGTHAEQSPDGATTGLEWLRNDGPTGLIKELAEIGKGYKSETTRDETLSELQRRTVPQWIKLLEPEGVEEALLDKINRARGLMAADITKKEVKIGNRSEPNPYYVEPNPGGDDSIQAQDVIDEVRKTLSNLAGDVNKESLELEGGRIKPALQELKKIHTGRFQAALRVTLQEVLNGRKGAPALEARAGKLGYLLAYLTQVHETLQEAQKALERTEGGRKAFSAETSKDLKKRRDEPTELLKDADEKMKKKGGWGGGNRKKYVEHAQALLEVYKREIAECVAYEVVEGLIKVAKDTLDELKQWRDTLATENVDIGGLYAVLLQGLRENSNDRKQSATTRVRHEISNDAYENLQYDQYVDKGGAKSEKQQLLNVLSELEWDVRIDDNIKRIVVALKLGTNALKREKGPNVGDANATVVLDRCRKVFDPAWGEMSVLRYLMDQYGVGRPHTLEELADFIRDNGGPLLEGYGTPTANPLPANFLRVHYASMMDGDQNEANKKDADLQSSFVENLLQRLAILHRISASMGGLETKVGTNRFVDKTDSMDRFKLSFVYFSELNQLQYTQSYHNAAASYRTYPQRRNYLHVFPAEEHAILYEQQLGQMKVPQRLREFEDRVTVQLEDLDNFKLIVQCLVYGDRGKEWGEGGAGLLLHDVQPPDSDAEPNPQSKMVWRLTVRPEGELRGDGRLYDPITGELALPAHYHLTELRHESELSLLEAINQFNYKKHDVRNEGDLIDMERVNRTLQDAVALDRDEQIARGLPCQMPSTLGSEELLKAQGRVAQYLRYQEWLNRWDSELVKYRDAVAAQGTGGPAAVVSPESQREADLRTVMYLVVQEMARTLKAAIDKQGIILTPHLPKPAPAPGKPPKPMAPKPPTPPTPLAGEQISGTEPGEATAVCPECGKTVAASKFCSACGKPLPAPVSLKPCSHCGAPLKETDRFCANCGTSVMAKRAVCDCGFAFQMEDQAFCPHCGTKR